MNIYGKTQKGEEILENLQTDQLYGLKEIFEQDIPAWNAKMKRHHWIQRNSLQSCEGLCLSGKAKQVTNTGNERESISTILQILKYEKTFLICSSNVPLKVPRNVPLKVLKYLFKGCSKTTSV